MPMSFQVETEAGAALESLLDRLDALTTLASEFESGALRIAQTVDPYGNTVLNGLQIRQLFLPDLEVLGSRASADERRLLVELRGLAERCLEEPHLYLKCYGD